MLPLEQWKCACLLTPGLFAICIDNHDASVEQDSTITSPIAASQGTNPRHQLPLSACKQIERYLLVPLLKEPKLEDFHPLVRSVPTRIANKQIVCLRDLEKILLWLAPVSALKASLT